MTNLRIANFNNLPDTALISAKELMTLSGRSRTSLYADPEHIYAVFVGTETNKAFFENNDAIWLGRVPTAQLLNRSA